MAVIVNLESLLRVDRISQSPAINRHWPSTGLTAVRRREADGGAERPTGANVTGALRLAERLGPAATIVTIMCDTGMRYLKSFAQAIG